MGLIVLGLCDPARLNPQGKIPVDFRTSIKPKSGVNSIAPSNEKDVPVLNKNGGLTGRRTANNSLPDKEAYENARSTMYESNASLDLWSFFQKYQLDSAKEKAVTTTVAGYRKRCAEIVTLYASGELTSYDELETAYELTNKTFDQKLGELLGNLGPLVIDHLKRDNITRQATELYSYLPDGCLDDISFRKLTDEWQKQYANEKLARFLDPYAIPLRPVEQVKIYTTTSEIYNKTIVQALSAHWLSSSAAIEDFTSTLMSMQQARLSTFLAQNGKYQGRFPVR